MRGLPLSAALCLMALSACQADQPVVEEGPGPVVQVATVVDGTSYPVELGLVYQGRSGDIYISEYGHPELAGNEGLARRIARAACTEAGRVFDDAVAAQPSAKASWLFVEACR